jgi:hypothetical protein
MRSDFRRNVAACSLVLLIAAAGCQTARVEDPVTAKLGGDDPDAQLAFWHTLAEQPVTSNDDAFHGLLLYLDGSDAAADYAGRVAALKDRRMLRRSFDEPADRAVSRGTLAVAIARALNLKGGLTMRALSPLGGGVPPARYAVRELMFAGVYPPSAPHQTFSGEEFLGIIGRVEDHQRRVDATDVPAAVLPGEAAAPTP